LAESHLDSVKIGAYRRRDVVDGGADVADLGRGVVDEDLDGASRLLPVGSQADLVLLTRIRHEELIERSRLRRQILHHLLTPPTSKTSRVTVGGEIQIGSAGSEYHL
jgi:hypothetical protein